MGRLLRVTTPFVCNVPLRQSVRCPERELEGTHWITAFCAPFNLGLVPTCSFTCFLCQLIVLFRTLPCKFIPSSSALASFPNVYFGGPFSFCRFCCWFAGLAGAGPPRRSSSGNQLCRLLRASMSMNSRFNRMSSGVSCSIRPSSDKGLVWRLTMQLSAKNVTDYGRARVLWRSASRPVAKSIQYVENIIIGDIGTLIERKFGPADSSSRSFLPT